MNKTINLKAGDKLTITVAAESSVSATLPAKATTGRILPVFYAVQAGATKRATEDSFEDVFGSWFRAGRKGLFNLPDKGDWIALRFTAPDPERSSGKINWANLPVEMSITDEPGDFSKSDKRSPLRWQDLTGEKWLNIRATSHGGKLTVVLQ